MNKQDWLVSLQKFAAECRAQRPVVDREKLSDEEEQQCRIIGGSLISWLNKDSDGMMRQRQVLSRMMGFDPQPIVVFKTSMPGLVAGYEILSSPSDRIVMLLSNEFDSWLPRNPVDSFTFHVEYASHFEPLPRDIRSKAEAAFPQVKPRDFRVHISDHLWGEHCGHRAQHLWEWTGSEMNLLEEAFTHVVY